MKGKTVIEQDGLFAEAIEKNEFIKFEATSKRHISKNKIKELQDAFNYNHKEHKIFDIEHIRDENNHYVSRWKCNINRG